MSEKKRIGVFIISYNGRDFLTKTIARIPRDVYNQIEEIYVIDDNSPDDSYDVALKYKEEIKDSKLNVYKNPKNQGYGGNQKSGYQYAIDKGLDIVVLLHGDGQYAPEVLATLLEPLISGKADAVFGSRMSQGFSALKGGMPLYKFFGNKILTFIQNKLSGLNLSEYHSGYRLYNVHALKEIPFQSFVNTWHFDTQILLALAEREKIIVERPIPTYYGDEICHVNGIPYAINCLKTTYQFYINKKKGVLSYPGINDIPRHLVNS